MKDTVRSLCKKRPRLLIARPSRCFSASGDLKIEGVLLSIIDLSYEALSCIIFWVLDIIGLSCGVFSLVPSQLLWNVTSLSRKKGVEGSRFTEVVDVHTTSLSYVDEKSSSISWIDCDIIRLCHIDIEMPDACEVPVHPYNHRHPSLL